ncbi:MAG: histidinol dehydrogenase [Fluviicola sp. XM-24bin1]|nr:MAG: histidinol dehydrogenase [Fluviicola sp. XM-24bin1]
MKFYQNPEKSTWAALTKRPSIEQTILEDGVRTIMQDVERNGNTALYRYTQLLDGCKLDDIQVSAEEIENAQISAELAEAIDRAFENIEKFHKSQLQEEPKVETTPGVTCWRQSIAIEKVGLYIPGGSAPLFSTILMLGIPAKIAGCKEIVLCTPPNSEGAINPAILYTAKRVGIEKVFKVGGAQAIAAMTVGTESIPSVSKIFGPGNQYVTKAKELAMEKGVGIDMPAGPSELLVIADASANPEFVAADLLSQAEHGADSQVILVSDSNELIDQTNDAIRRQLQALPRKETAQKALENSLSVSLNDLSSCMDFSNAYAPEHLIINTNDTEALASKVINAGSVFLGNYSCESAGDYASGTNHTLPTNGYARNYSGVSVDSFVRKITYQEITAEGMLSLGPAIELMAEAEELQAHKNAVTVRLKALKND